MASVLLLILSGSRFYFAAVAAMVGVGAVGDGSLCILFLFMASLVGGAATLLLFASHARHGWRDARRRTGILIVSASAHLLSGTLFVVILPFDPSIRAIVSQTSPTLAAIGLWRVVLAASVPIVAIASGVWLLRGDAARDVPPDAGLISTSAGP